MMDGEAPFLIIFCFVAGLFFGVVFTLVYAEADSDIVQHNVLNAFCHVSSDGEYPLYQERVVGASYRAYCVHNLTQYGSQDGILNIGVLD